MANAKKPARGLLKALPRFPLRQLLCKTFRSHGADLGHGGFEVQGFCHKSWDLGRRMFYGPKSEEESDLGLLGQTSEVLFRHGDTQASSSQRRLATFSGTPSWPSESTGLLSSLEVLP